MLAYHIWLHALRCEVGTLVVGQGQNGHRHMDDRSSGRQLSLIIFLYTTVSRKLGLEQLGAGPVTRVDHAVWGREVPRDLILQARNLSSVFGYGI